MAYKISKQTMKEELNSGKSLRQIGREYNISKSMIQYISKQYMLKSNWSKRVEFRRKDDSFEVVDKAEQAYIIGLLLGDGSVNKNQYVSLVLKMQDRAVVEWLGAYLNTPVNYSYKLDKARRIFPRAGINARINFIDRYLGTGLKPTRHFPRLKKELEPYLLRGLFEADGCITGGIRADRSRFWTRITITHHQKCLEGVQKFLYSRLGVSSTVRLKSSSNCFLLEIHNKEDVFKVMEYMYADKSFMPMKRKYDKYRAVLLESDKFMGGKQVAL